MDPPQTVSVESKPKPKPEQSNESKPKSYECGLCDTEVVYKIAQELLPGLASACVDNTTGGIFKNAGSVAVDMRKEMCDYLLHRSETYVAEFLLSENSPVLETSQHHPYDIIILLIDDFTASKRNMLSRVSEWVFSDGREDKIDDFVQEMEVNGFWLLPRRVSVAETLLKNVDYKNAFHCNEVLGSEEEVCKHKAECKFRGMDCLNEGCTTRYCAAQKENHDSVCPFLILPCEQKCSDFVMRREMDRHCVTICPMKLVNCAFYTVGCKSCIPRSNVEQHNVDELSAHLLFIIKTAHKEANDDDLKHRVEQIRSLANTEKLARARDARALTYLIKDAEAKLEPLQPKTDLPETPTINKIDPPTETEPLIVKDGPTKTEPVIVNADPPAKKEDQPVLPPSQPANEVKASTEKLAVKDVQLEAPKPVEPPEPLIKIEESKDKPESSSTPIVKEKEEKSEPPLKKEEVPTDSKEEKISEPPLKKEEVPKDLKEEKKSEPPLKKEEAPLKKEEVQTDLKEEKNSEPPLKKEEPPLKKEEPPVTKEETPLKKEEPPLKKEEPPLKKEEVQTDLKEGKGGKPSDSKEEGEKLQESIKEKSTQLSSSDEQDNKKTSPKKEETIEESAKAPTPAPAP